MERDRIERNIRARVDLWFVPGMNVLRIDGRAKDIVAIRWVCDPGSLRSVEDGVSPRADVEREPVCVDVTDVSVEAPVVIFVKVDEVEERDDLGNGGKGALKVDTHGGGVIGIRVEVANVFTSGVLHIARCKREHINDGGVQSRVGPGYDVNVGGGVGDLLQRRIDADVTAIRDV